MKKNLRYTYLFDATRHRIDLKRNVNFDAHVNEYLNLI